MRSRTSVHVALGSIAMGICLSVGAPAQDDEKAPGDVDDIHEKIEKIEVQMENLEQERAQLERRAAEAEHRAERKEILQRLHAESRECLEHHNNEIAELDREGEPASIVQQAARQARRDNLEALCAVHRELLAINDETMLPEAMVRMARHELLSTEWWMIVEPKHSFNMRIEEMERHAADEGTANQREIITKLKALHEQEMTNRMKSLDLFKKNQESRFAKEKLFREFWGNR